MSRFPGVDLLEFDSLLSEEERLVRDTVRAFVDDKVKPIIEECHRDARTPLELVPEMGALNLFGASLTEYGLPGLGGVAFASALASRSGPARAAAQAEFYFVQLSDTHWGFKGPAVNPQSGATLQRAVAAVNALDHQPDFVVFTGDLTHTTDDPKERRRRMAEFRDIAGGLKARRE